ncbi:MAG TPA: TonB-dependent copper receptor [Rheinheimera sp.]|nr:TonB-dependent copper receptor [Rheinheimera sp.]
MMKLLPKQQSARPRATPTLTLSVLMLSLLPALCASSAYAGEHHTQHGKKPNKDNIEHIVITGEAPEKPGVVVTDPKAARQPLPAHDGADYLKTIAGFAVTRKGGTDGDASFRGMAGSRLGILVDGENILGGCNYRMDAPTAYIYPELHDQMTVIKGPQSVRYGAGHSAATVLFERTPERFDQAGYRLHSSLLGASFERYDELIDATLGNQQGYLRFGGSQSRARDYQDGNGDAVHSNYHRYSGQVALGYTPTTTSLFEASVARSDGQAAYADRGMDGTRFLRDSTNVRYQQTDISPWLDSVKLHWYSNEVDHLMDDQELRPKGMMGYANLARATSGGSAQFGFNLPKDQQLLVGVDRQSNQHDSRSGSPMGVYGNWHRDADISQTGLFGEYQYSLAEHQQLFAGYRLDRWTADDLRSMVGNMMTGMKPNPTYGQQRQDTMHSGFVRYEQELTSSPTTWYFGVGQAQRFPDYWELIAKEGQSSLSGFNIQHETTTQLDTGVLFGDDTQQWSLSGFYGKVADYILVDYASMMKMNGFVRNVDARTYGAEATYQRKFAKHWVADAALSYLRGDNQSDHTPLPQQSPTELRLGGRYVAQNYSVGLLWRGVAAQTRYDLKRGTIVGQDLGPSQGFAIVSVNAAWQVSEGLNVSSGIDNLFDRQYAEFVSRAGGNGMGGAIPGFIQTTRVNEPGRTVWLKLTYSISGGF